MNAFMHTLHSLSRRAPFAVILAAVGVSSVLADSTSFVSDDFNTRNLKRPLWTFISPRADEGVSAVNSGTDSASIAIYVPGGRAHDIDESGYRVPRIMQAATDTDFRLEVKFLSSVTGGTLREFQVQGVVIQQDANNIIRFDFTTGVGPNIIVYAASFIGGFSSGTVHVAQEIAAYGTRPLFLRVERSGDTWTQSYSFDGTVWTVAGSFDKALAVSAVGAFAGNAGWVPPAHTALIDYFINLDNPGAPDDTSMAYPDTTAPLVHNVRAVELAPNAMRIEWRTDEASTGALDIGKTIAYGTTYPSSTPGYVHSVFATDLSANTNYNFQVTATDDSANVEVSGNATARTATYSFDVASISDDFIGSAVDAGLWTEVDPIGDGSATVAGGKLSLAVPGGIPHDIWTTGAMALRLMQPVSSPNALEVEALFLTGVFGTASAYRVEGILVEEDSNDMIRFDFVNGTGGTRAFAAAFDNGFATPLIGINKAILPARTSPLYLRVTQLGAKWTMSYSIDGLSWTEAGSFWHILRPTRVGVFAANAGTSAPSFTSEVEYFRAVRPARAALGSPESGTVDIEVGPTLTWKPALQAATYHLEVAIDSLFTTVVLNDTTLTDTSRVATGLAYSTKYFWRVRGKNGSGYGEYSAVWSFTTRTSAPDTPAPVSPANGASELPTSLSVRWNRVPNATSYRVQVSTEPTFSSGLIVDDPAVIDTSKSLAALSAGTTYYWRVNASSPGGTSDYSSTFSFTTQVAIPGTVTLLTPEAGASVNAAGVSFTWEATPGATKYWHELAVDALFTFVIIDSAVSTPSKDVTGLIPNQTYYWRVRAGNGAGWGPFSVAREFTAVVVGVENERGIPTEFGISQNFPNPFNPSTTIEFALPREAYVTVDVYNALGERIATLVDETRAAGYHTVAFDASSLPSGVYLYRISAGDFASVRKMLLMK